MLEELSRYFERALTLTLPAAPVAGGVKDWMGIVDAGGVPSEVDELLGVSDDAARLLGKRTAELHQALAEPTPNAGFGAEAMTAGDMRELSGRVQRQAGATFEVLKEALSRLPDEVVEQAGRLVRLRRRAMALLQRVDGLDPAGSKIRIHGDYHLGQVLRSGADFVILDFEGEPSRPLAERRARQSALRDVAGMLRSFAYAARAGLVAHTTRHPGDAERLTPWAQLWERSVSGVFLSGYLRATGEAAFLPGDREALTTLLSVHVLEKALYELHYELDNRPGWAHIPIAGLLTLLDGHEG
jgi:maltose alpha-D-glucosyltransferase/alpha-amylase